MLGKTSANEDGRTGMTKERQRRNEEEEAPLQNAYLIAKIGADTPENERNFAENLPKIGNYPTGPLPYGP